MIMPIPALFPLIPIIRDEINASYFQFSIFLASLGIVRLLSAYPSGIIADRFNGKKILLFSGCLCIAGLLIMGFVHSFYQLLISRVMIGLSSIICNITLLSLLVQLADPECRGGMISMNNVAHNLGSVFSPALAGFIAKWYGWRISFFVLAAFVLFSMAMVIIFLKEQSVPDQQRRRKGKHSSNNNSYKNNKFWLRLMPVFAISFFVFFYRGYFRHTLLPFFGKDVFIIEVDTLGLYFSLTGVIATASLFVFGFLSDRIGRKAVLVPGIFLSTVAALSLLLPQAANPLLICCIFIGLGSIINSMPNVLISDLVPSNIFGKIIGLNRIFADSGYFIGTIAVGVLLDQFGFKIPLYCIAGYATAIMIMTAFAIPNRA